VDNRIGSSADLRVDNKLDPSKQAEWTTGLVHQQKWEWCGTGFAHQHQWSRQQDWPISKQSGQQQGSPTRRGRSIAMKTNSGINRFRNW